VNGLELAAVITAVGGFIGVVASLVVNARRLVDLQEQINAERQRAEATRGDIVRLGENYQRARIDNEILAATFNDLWLEIYEITGQRPRAKLDRLRELTTLRQSETGRLGPLG
jgi:hypothetical protein